MNKLLSTIAITIAYLLLLAVSIFVACSQIGCAAQGRHTVYRDHVSRLDNTIKISYQCGLLSWTGSGVLIGGSDALTAYHVVECESPVKRGKAELQTGEVFTFEVVYANKGLDVARIRMDREPGSYSLANPVPIGKVRTGDWVCLNPATPTTISRCGEVLRAGTGKIYHSAITIPGNSGGGVYSRNGSLVGIVTQSHTCYKNQICGGLASTLHGLPGTH